MGLAESRTATDNRQDLSLNNQPLGPSPAQGQSPSAQQPPRQSASPSRLVFGGVPLSDAERFPDSPFGAGDPFASSTQHAPPPGPLPQVQQTVHIKNDVNLDKDSMRLIPSSLFADRVSPSEPAMVEATSSSSASSSTAAAAPKAIKFMLQFTLDLASECNVTIFFGAKEVVDPNSGLISIQSTSESATPSGRLTKLTAHFSAGSGQLYHQPEDQLLDLTLFQKEELESDGTADTIPLVVQLDAISKDTGNIAHSQFTYASFVNINDNIWIVKPLKQIVQINRVVYEVFEIYGIHGKEEDDNLCVVCISEPKTITCLPCRHMCLCRQCAKALRLQTNKCPICRSVIQSFLRVTPEDPATTPADDSANSDSVHIDVPGAVGTSHSRTRSGEQVSSRPSSA